MSVTYTDQVRPAAARPAARIDGEAYVPVYARSGARKSNKPVKTWMILAPLGVLAVGGAAAAMLMQPAAPAEEAAPFAPLAAQLAASETAPLPLPLPSMPMETPAELTTAAPIPPSAAAPVERRGAPAAPARAAARAAAAPEAVEAPVTPTGPQPYLSVAPQTVAPQPTAPMIEAPAAPVSSSAAPTPIVIAPTT
jgi:hypothetical protein